MILTIIDRHPRCGVSVDNVITKLSHKDSAPPRQDGLSGAARDSSWGIPQCARQGVWIACAWPVCESPHSSHLVASVKKNFHFDEKSFSSL